MNPANIMKIAAVADEIRDILGDDYDPETFADTLDGETDYLGMIGKLILAKVDADAQAEACRGVAAMYTDRARAATERATRHKAAIRAVMEAAGERRVRHPLATLTMTQGRPPLILSPDFVPEGDFAKVTVAPDRTRLLKALNDGANIPGATLGNPEPTLTMRLK